MNLGFLNSSDDIISGDLGEIPPNCDKVSGEIEPEKKRNDSDMEIGEDYGKYTEVYANRKSDVWSESGKHEGFYDYEPDLEENLPPEYQGDPNSIVGDLYNQFEVYKDDY